MAGEWRVPQMTEGIMTKKANGNAMTVDVFRATADAKAKGIAAWKGDTVTINFAGDAEPVEVTIGALPEAMVRELVLHGLKQKLVDAAAISRDPVTGASASIADKRTAVSDVARRLIEGNWTKPKGEPATPKGGLLFAAMKRTYPEREDDEIRTFLTARTAKQRSAMLASSILAPAIAEIRAAKVADEPAGDDLLAGF